jgi:hypothetical protein
LGDAGFFDRIVPDTNALALELRHSAAYSLRSPGRAPAPTSWPWGPLPDSSLYDPTAASRLPLARHFDGIGVVVARSDWTPEATYVTFKAGDHYWSHVHLDSGSFTLYKGGALALDAGLYGPGYGSDHHMNYTIQSVAHNVVTVTDPADTEPMPTRKEKPPRPIANDGGQRRVGSGWGIEAAPLDLDEWNAKREIYHTGRIEAYTQDDGLVVAVADVTPAYTNALSGRGTFSHRTRRVERLWRTFAYDAVDDVVVVWDDVRSRRASFRKRWLLHTTQRPRVEPGGFTVEAPQGSRRGQGGGRLVGHVLLPKSAGVLPIGGPGYEYYVDGVNYDEGGKVAALVANAGQKAPEPGAWRVEVMPPVDALEDQFLVVMLPAAPGSTPTHAVRLLEEEGRVGCEVRGPQRTTRWWFTPRVRGVTVEVSDASGARRREIGSMQRDAEPQGPRVWLDRLLDELLPAKSD